MGCGLYNEENSIPSFDIFILSQEMTSVNRRLLNLVLNIRHRERETSTVTKEITRNAVSPLTDTSRLIMSRETVEFHSENHRKQTHTVSKCCYLILQPVVQHS